MTGSWSALPWCFDGDHVYLRGAEEPQGKSAGAHAPGDQHIGSVVTQPTLEIFLGDAIILDHWPQEGELSAVGVAEKPQIEPALHPIFVGGFEGFRNGSRAVFDG